MQAFGSVAVENTFLQYPQPLRDKLLGLRELVFRTAAADPRIGVLEETLKWGEPAYLTTRSKSGSTLRLGWKKAAPTSYAMYFHCQTNLVESFRLAFPNDFRYEGNRAIVFEQDDVPDTDALSMCIAAALTYHLAKKA